LPVLVRGSVPGNHNRSHLPGNAVVCYDLHV